jgi:hypothetical protein
MEDNVYVRYVGTLTAAFDIAFLQSTPRSYSSSSDIFFKPPTCPLADVNSHVGIGMGKRDGDVQNNGGLQDMCSNTNNRSPFSAALTVVKIQPHALSKSTWVAYTAISDHLYKYRSLNLFPRQPMQPSFSFYVRERYKRELARQ